MVTSKVDVYAYGILMLELLTGKLPVDDSNGDSNSGDASHLVAWVKAQAQLNPGSASVVAVLDPYLIPVATDAAAVQQMLGLQEIGLMCTHKQPAARPSIRGVEAMLDALMTPTDDPSIMPAAKEHHGHDGRHKLDRYEDSLEAREPGLEPRTRGPWTRCDQLPILSSSHHIDPHA